MQYTIRGVSPAVDRALRERARQSGTSLNETALAVLTEGVGLGTSAGARRDVSDIAGSWVAEDSVEEALLQQDIVDEALWA